MARRSKADAGERRTSFLGVQLTPTERAHLFELAQGRPPTRHQGAPATVSPALQHVLDAHPFPAFALTFRWDIVAWNRSAARLYADEADRFFSASMLVWLSLLVAASLAFAALAGLALALGVTPGSKFGPGAFVILYIPGALMGLVLLLAAGAAEVVLNDFILPHMVVEGAAFRKAWADVRALMAANRESFVRYFLLRMGLPLAAGLVLGLLAWVVESVVFGTLGISAAGFTAMLNGAPGWRLCVSAVVRAIFALLGLGAGAAIAVSFAGPLGVFMRIYALAFYGSHYKALGNLLDPPTHAAEVHAQSD